MAIDINYPAVRAFTRAWAPIAESHAEGAQADAGFDAGEFSGPAHATLEHDAYWAALERVAERFRLTVVMLDRMCYAAGMIELDHWRDANHV